MSAFFVVLKVIGIVIICLLAVLFTVALLVLFWPIKYKAYLNYQNDKLQYDIEVSWLLKFILFRMSNYPVTDILFRLGWKRFTSDKNSDDNTSDCIKAEHSDNANDYESDRKETRTESNKETTSPDTSDLNSENAHADELEDTNKLKEIIQKIKIIYNYNDKDKIIKASILLLKRTWKATKPYVLNLKCEIGFETPDMTGYALGVTSIIKTFIDTEGLNIYIKGNFEKQVTDINLDTKGKFMLFSALWPLVAFVFTEPVWKIIKQRLFKKNKDNQ